MSKSSYSIFDLLKDCRETGGTPFSSPVGPADTPVPISGGAVC